MANVTKLTPMQKELNYELICAVKNSDTNKVKVLVEMGRMWMRRVIGGGRRCIMLLR